MMSNERAQNLIKESYHKDGNEAPLDEILSKVIGKDIKHFKGGAESALITDPLGLHKGEIVEYGDRLILSVRYQHKDKKIISKFPTAEMTVQDWKKTAVSPEQRVRFKHILKI